eukprot:352594-Chlamydomonas_euryale.AAC.6
MQAEPPMCKGFESSKALPPRPLRDVRCVTLRNPSTPQRPLLHNSRLPHNTVRRHARHAPVVFVHQLHLAVWVAPPEADSVHVVDVGERLLGRPRREHGTCRCWRVGVARQLRVHTDLHWVVVPSRHAAFPEDPPQPPAPHDTDNVRLPAGQAARRRDVWMHRDAGTQFRHCRR